MIPEGLRTGVDLGEGGLGAKAEADYPGGHSLWQLQGCHHLAGFPLMVRAWSAMARVMA